MNRERYLSLMQWARERKEREMILCGMTKWIPFVLAFIYIISILFCIFMYPIAMPRLVFRPLLCFITVTFIRNILKAPRHMMSLILYHCADIIQEKTKVSRAVIPQVQQF